MSSLKDQIADILGQMQLCALATVTAEGKPWVRYVMAVADAEMNIRSATFVNARKVQQIRDNPEVHLVCGVNDPTEMKPYLQIQGRAQVTTDHDERHEFWTDVLAAYFDGPDDPKYAVIVIEPYRVERWTADTYEPEVWAAAADEV